LVGSPTAGRLKAGTEQASRRIEGRFAPAILEAAGGGKGDPKGQEYLVVTLKEVMVSSV